MNQEKRQMYQYDGKEVATFAGGCFWCLEAINIAIEMELDGKECYLAASEDSEEKKTKKVVRFLVLRTSFKLLS